MGDSSFNIQNYFKRGKTVVLTLRQGDSDEIRQWSDKDTSLLLSLISQFFLEFQNVSRRKKEIWADVSKELTDEGYPWSAEDCRKKWSNMVRTFKGIHEQKLDPIFMTKKVKWPFFECMLELFSREGADFLPEATNVVQMLNNPEVTSSNSNNKQTHVNPNRVTSSTVVIDEEMVDYQAIINATSGNEITIVETVGPGTEIMEEEQPSTSSDSNLNNIASSSTNLDGSNNIINSGIGSVKVSASTPSTTKASSKIPSKSKRKKSRCRTKSSMDSGVGELTGDSIIMDKFIAATTKQNEQMLASLSSFHQEALSAMRQRNEILRKLCDTLERQTQNSLQNNSTINFQSPSVPHPRTSHLITISESGTTQSESVVSCASNIHDLTVLPDGVTVLDSDMLHKLMAHPNNTTGLTFHLDVPTTSDLGNLGNGSETRITKGFRLENIPSDVNLSAFSATLHPTLVSVNPSKKPRSSLTKSVSVPLHTTSGNRKIAPKKNLNPLH